MQITHARKTILLENPRCASASVALFLGTRPVDGIPYPNATIREAQTLLPSPQWESYTKLTVVRDSVDRFTSAVAALRGEQPHILTDDEISWYGGEAYRELWNAANNTPSDATACKNVLAALRDLAKDGLTPRMFLPQGSFIVTGEGTLHLAWNDLVTWANANPHTRALHIINDTRHAKPSGKLADQVYAFYAEDAKLLASLRVWAWPGPFRQLSGSRPLLTEESAKARK